MGSVAAGCRAEEKGALLFYRFQFWADGYVKTMFNRIRPIPELKSSNFMQRNFGERVAMNSPIQGTAADIIKIAMVRVNMKLKEKQMKSRLLLQIHDELLIETHLDEFEEVKEILQNEMMNAVSLRVPLNIDIEQGASWYEAK
jgi:DNA polymerase-1